MTNDRPLRRIVYGANGEPVMTIDETPTRQPLPWLVYVLMVLCATGFFIVLLEWAHWEIQNR